jgi:hypothetical protein
MTDYLYWVVDCKTSGCESPILLYFLGPRCVRRRSPSVCHDGPRVVTICQNQIRQKGVD